MTTLVKLKYGSHLYGTNTPTSDTDYYEIYMPELANMLLEKKLDVKRTRVDKNGVTIKDTDSMTPEGMEISSVPFQHFIDHVISGQAYAIEILFAIQQGLYEEIQEDFLEFVVDFLPRYMTKNIKGMMGFALKQTFDYVNRGERKGVLEKILTIIDQMKLSSSAGHRLVTPLYDCSVMEYIAKNCDLKIIEKVIHNKPEKFLVFNEREYSQHTELSHFRELVKKAIDKYGDRSSKALEDSVDWKSLSHAVRVYQQCIEYLETGQIQFPRPNIDQLVKIKQGLVDKEEVKNLLKALDTEVQDKLENSTMPSRLTEGQRDHIDEAMVDLICLLLDINRINSK